MKMLLGLPEALSSITKRKFEAAKASSDLLFSPTELAIIRTSAGFSRLDGDVCTAKGAFTVSAGFVSIGEVQPWAELEVFCVDAEQSGAVP